MTKVAVSAITRAPTSTPYPVFDQTCSDVERLRLLHRRRWRLRYSQTGYQYVAEHPIGHIHGGGYCFMSWPHRHWFAPIGVNFVWSNAGYAYNGPWGSDYYSLRPRYVTYYNDYYRRWYLGGRYYSLRPSHTYIGFGWHRPMARRPYYGGGGYYRPGYGGLSRPAPVYRPPVYQNPRLPSGTGHSSAPAYRPAPVYQAPAYRAPVYPGTRVSARSGVLGPDALGSGLSRAGLFGPWFTRLRSIEPRFTRPRREFTTHTAGANRPICPAS